MVIEDDKQKMNAGRLSIVVVCILVMLLAFFNPPQIYIILLLSGTVVVCSWFPVCIASVWSKRVTKAGAFAGMLCGFMGCALMKIISTVGDISIPIYLDSFVVGIVANMVALITVSSLTKVSEEEIAARNKMFIAPLAEKNPADIKRTKITIVGFIVFGACVTVALLLLWVIPYHSAL